MPNDTRRTGRIDIEDAIKTVQTVSDRISEAVSMDIAENPDHEFSKHARKHLDESERLESAANALRRLLAEVRAWRKGLRNTDPNNAAFGYFMDDTKALDDARRATDEAIAGVEG